MFFFPLIETVTYTCHYMTHICKNIFSLIDNSNLQLIQYKILHRVHITQQRKYKMGFSNSPICTQCNLGTLDTYLHSFWYCTPVQNFWLVVTEKLHMLLDIEIPVSPSFCLLGLGLETEIASHYVQLVYIALILAKKAILQHWKTKQFLMERMAALSRKNIRSFLELWSPFINFFGLEE